MRVLATSSTLLAVTLAACDRPNQLTSSSFQREAASVHAAAGGGNTGIWIGAEELALLPTSGPAWENVKAAADTDLRGGVLTDRDDHNVRTMAAALVAARLDDHGYRARVHDALRDVVAAGVSDDALAAARRLGTYAISADLIGLGTFDPAFDADFRAWLLTMRGHVFDEGWQSVIGIHERRPNNWGTQAGASRIAVDRYIGDAADLERAAQVFRGYLGDRASYAGFSYGNDLSWQCDPTLPVGINPEGCSKEGHSIDGVLPDDQRRGCAFQWPPCRVGYAWGGLQGAVAQAWLLHRAGYPAFEWEERAVLRAYTWLHEQADYPAEGDDTWQPHLANYVHGTSFPAPVPTRPGKNVGWTDWTHGARPEAAPLEARVALAGKPRPGMDVDITVLVSDAAGNVKGAAVSGRLDTGGTDYAFRGTTNDQGRLKVRIDTEKRDPLNWRIEATATRGSATAGACIVYDGKRTAPCP